MNRTILLAAGFSLALGALSFTISCSDDKSDDNNNGGAAAKKYCKVGNPRISYCLEMPESECSADFYKGKGYNALWGQFDYEPLSECAKSTPDVACCYTKDNCSLASTSTCTALNGKSCKTIKECADYSIAP
jgi:hypothetical protein